MKFFFTKPLYMKETLSGYTGASGAETEELDTAKMLAAEVVEADQDYRRKMQRKAEDLFTKPWTNEFAANPDESAPEKAPEEDTDFQDTLDFFNSHRFSPTNS